MTSYDIIESPASAGMPLMSVEDSVARYEAFRVFVSSCLRYERDFGPGFPGSDKKTLLKPGAEKMITFFGLSVRFECVEKIEDWTGEKHGGEPLFAYTYRAIVSRGERLVCTADAHASSWESKYRWRKANRFCPACGNTESLIKGKAEYGGGWICFGRKGGCGAKFAEKDPSIIEQQVGRVQNTDIYDQINTIMKMAEKRALVAATLIACNASDYFAQDADDLTEPPADPQEPPREEPPPPPNPNHRDQMITRIKAGSELLKRDFGMVLDLGEESDWGWHTLESLQDAYREEKERRARGEEPPTGSGETVQDAPWKESYPKLSLQVESMLYRAQAFGVRWEQIEEKVNKPLSEFTAKDVASIQEFLNRYTIDAEAAS